MSKEKKKTIILTIALSVICLVLIGITVIIELKQNGVIVDEETSEIMEEFYEEFNSKERTVIYFSRTGCSWCESQQPVLETIAEDYDMDYLKLDIATIGKKQVEEIIEKLGLEGGTPSTIIVQNGKVIDKVEGYVDGNEYVEFFASNEVIPEDAVYSKENNLTHITYEDYEEIIAKSGTHIVTIGKTGCSWCEKIKPALNSIAGEYDLKVNYLNLMNIKQDDYNSFVESLTDIGFDDEDFVNSGSLSTPTTLIISDGEVKDYIVGGVSKSKLVREFKKAGLISE